MTYSNKCMELVKRFEGCRLKAYDDGAGNWTIGYGHTRGVKKGMRITSEQAENYLKQDLDSAYSRITKWIMHYNFNQNQVDALTSFAYNVGSIDELCNYGRCTVQKISERIPLFVYAGHKKMPGLVLRRSEEKKLFDTESTYRTYTPPKYFYGSNYRVFVKAGLNVRQSPSVDSKIIKTYKYGTTFTCLDTKTDDKGSKWVKTPSGWVCCYYKPTYSVYAR